MELKGKKMAFLGDSITEGCGVADFANVYFMQIFILLDNVKD